MTFKEQENKVNESWTKLYRRLEQDGLLPDTNGEDNHSTNSFHAWKWAAAIAVLLISGLTFYFWQHRIDNTLLNNEKLVLQNTIGNPTLVSSLEDGSTVYLSEQASIEYPVAFAENKREVSLQGNAFFEIDTDPGRPFIIHTTPAIVEVLGTSFAVQSSENSFSLSVKTGKVKVTSRQKGESILAIAGETVLLQASNLLCQPTTDLSQFVTYLQHIHFKDQPLSTIIRIMNERIGEDCLQLSPELENRLLTVTFSDESSEDIARLICLALNLNYVQQQNTFSITPVN